MQIIHKIDDFFFTLFPDLPPDNKDVLTSFFFRGCINSYFTGKSISDNKVLFNYYVSWTLAMLEQVQHFALDFKKEFEMAKLICKA